MEQMKIRAEMNRLWIEGAIVQTDADRWSMDDVCPSQFRAALDSMPDGEIELHLNSPGGDVFAAIEMYNLLKQRGNITVYIEGLAASAASVIAMAGDRIIMPANTYLMIHCAYTTISGNAKEAQKVQDRLNEIDGIMEQIYTERASVPAEEIKAMMDAETWLTAEKAAEIFPCVEQQGAIMIAAYYDGVSAPKAYREQEKNALLREVEKLEMLIDL